MDFDVSRALLSPQNSPKTSIFILGPQMAATMAVMAAAMATMAAAMAAMATGGMPSGVCNGVCNGVSQSRP